MFSHFMDYYFCFSCNYRAKLTLAKLTPHCCKALCLKMFEGVIAFPLEFIIVKNIKYLAQDANNMLNFFNLEYL